MFLSRNRKNDTRSFLKLQSESWALGGAASVKSRQKAFLYDVHRVKHLPAFEEMLQVLNVGADELLFGFEIALRYFSYGQLANENTYYLSHPFRELQSFPHVTRDSAPPPQVPVRVGPYIGSMLKSLTLDEYTILLHRARGVIRDDMKIAGLKPNVLGKEELRELAIKIGLPARLQHHSKVTSSLSILSSGVSATAALSAFGTGTTLSPLVDRLLH